jgi:hypothetical protein
MKLFLFTCIIFPLFSYAAFFVPSDVTDRSFLIAISAEDYDDFPLTECLSDDSRFGVHNKMMKDYLIIVESYILNSDEFKAYVSSSYDSKQCAADAWGRIDSTVTSSMVRVRRVYDYGLHYFLILTVKGEVTFVNLKYEGGALKLTNEVKRDGEISHLINFVESRCSRVKLDGFNESINNIVPMFESAEGGLPTNVLNGGSLGISLPLIAFKTESTFSPVTLSDAISATSLSDEVRDALAVLHAASLAVKQEDDSLFSSFWVKAERERVASWTKRDDLNATLKNQYGFNLNIQVSSIVTIGTELNIIYLADGARVVYMMKEDGEWRIANKTVYTSSFRAMMESDEILTYLKLRRGTVDLPALDYLNQFIQ